MSTWGEKHGEVHGVCLQLTRQDLPTSRPFLSFQLATTHEDHARIMLICLLIVLRRVGVGELGFARVLWGDLTLSWACQISRVKLEIKPGRVPLQIWAPCCVTPKPNLRLLRLKEHVFDSQPQAVTQAQAFPHVSHEECVLGPCCYFDFCCHKTNPSQE